MSASQPADPRDKFVDAAMRRFAEKGFYGASLAAMTRDLGLTKQALLHHFGSKERLYGEVLQRISRRYRTLVAEATAAAATPEEQLVAFFGRLYAETVTHPAETQLLMRELLDNRRRAGKAAQWYLKPFLEELVRIARRTERWRGCTESETLAGLYQLLGAVNYFAVSEPTLTQMFGRPHYLEVRRDFPRQLERSVRAILAAPPPAGARPSGRRRSPSTG